MKSPLFSFLFSAFLPIIFVGITFQGCTDNLDNSIVTAPTITDNTFIHPDLPLNASARPTDKLRYTSKFIDGEIGGELKIDSTYINSEGREINVYARLKIPPGSFQGTINIVMVPNDADLSIQLFPEMAFNRVVKLDLVFSGINLKAFGYTTNGVVDFNYFDDNGTIELIETHQSIVNIHHNRISVRTASLHHFSRYGWSR